MGGVPRNNNLLVDGPPGSGKTTLGLGFIYAGAALYDEPGAIISFELDPQKLLRDAAGFNWPMQELIDAGGYTAARERGTLRIEGRDYVMRDGDVINFRFNV